jgi:hypothetical protein
MEYAQDIKQKGTPKFHPDIKKAKKGAASVRYLLIGMETRIVPAVTIN